MPWGRACRDAMGTVFASAVYPLHAKSARCSRVCPARALVARARQGDRARSRVRAGRVCGGPQAWWGVCRIARRLDAASRPVLPDRALLRRADGTSLGDDLLRSRGASDSGFLGWALPLVRAAATGPENPRPDHAR